MSGAAVSGGAVRIAHQRNGLALDVVVPDAPVVALAGPNGAGKTTVLRILAGLEPATVEWLVPAPATIGYLPQRVSLYPAMSLLANVASSVRFAGGSHGAARARGHELLERFGVADLAARRPSEVSGGQRQRAGLARALAARPDLVLLDEPFVAIDVTTRDDVRAGVLAELRAGGARCIVATHDAADVEAADAAVLLG